MNTTGRISIHKLKESDIRGCKATSFIGEDGVIVELNESWKEIVIALMTVLNIAKRGKLLKALFDAKISSPNLIITKDKVKTYNFEDNTQYKIDGTNHYIICDCKPIEYLGIIKKLCIACNMNIKECYVEVAPYSTVEQDIKIITKKRELKTEFIRLSDIKSHEISKYKVIGIQIGLETYACKSNKDVIEAILNTIKSKTEYWYTRIEKYNKEGRISVQLDESSNNGYRVELKMSKAEVLEYISTILGEFGIDRRRIVLLIKEINFRNK